MFGILTIDKPTGLTSRDVVNRVQRLVRPAKVGHAGTLDPLASGVLVVCVGPATRLISYIQQMPKHYRATFLLGRESDTEDIEGQVVELDLPPRPSDEELRQTLQRFTGEISQRPPSYSALKVNGQRAYKLARAGQHVELAARPVTIYELQLVSYDYPHLQVDAVCSSGTYVRSLGRDIAESVGTAAVMSALTRNAIGSFRLDETVSIDALAADGPAAHLLPALRATAELVQVTLTDDEISTVLRGMTIENRSNVRGPEIAAVDKQGQLVAILVPRGENRLGPKRNFAVVTPP